MREGGLLSTRERVRENGTHLKKCGMILITALFGFVILAAAGQFGRTAQAVINLPAMVLLAVAANVDMQRNVIPDWVTLPGLAWALLASAFLGGPRLSDSLLGVALCGGGALLRGIDKLLTKSLGIPAYLVDNPMTCVVEGAVKALPMYNILRRNLPQV